MKERARGSVKRIAITVAYPNGTQHIEVIEGARLARLDLIAFSGQAVARHLPRLKGRRKAEATFKHGFDAPARGKPAMLLLFADGSYKLECDMEGHRPLHRE